MLIQGTALIQSVTLTYSCHGEPGGWRVRVAGPNHIEHDGETKENTPYDLLHPMLLTTYSEIARRFPERAPPYRDIRIRR